MMHPPDSKRAALAGSPSNSKQPKSSAQNIMLSRAQIKRNTLAELAMIAIHLQREQIEVEFVRSAVADGAASPEYAYPLIASYYSGRPCV